MKMEISTADHIFCLLNVLYHFFLSAGAGLGY